ncbi:MAG: polysaccharide deacetylase family protein, partial [Actinomycetota bacterium]|nr:polysaccharide deacetylase family protein [Actinomycetota bacterium]
HAVSERWPEPLSVTPERLEGQIRSLLRHGYRPATFTQAVVAPPAARTFAVTFDDAYRSVVSLALPILSALGLPGTVFACTDFVGSEAPMTVGLDRWIGSPHEPELVSMSWGELALLAGAGWEVGSHTRSHPRLTRLDDASLEAELSGSKQRCEDRLGGPCTALAYPHGDFDSRVVTATGEAGYLTAATTFAGRLDAPPRLQWPRINVARDDGGWRFRLKVSRTMRRVRSLRGWETVDRLRGVEPAARPGRN